MLTEQQTPRPLYLLPTSLCTAGTSFSLYCHSACASLSRYQLAFWKNIFPVVVGTRQRGGWLSSGTATSLVLALIWRRGNRDLTALPKKSDPSDARKRESLPDPSLHTNVRTCMHTNTYTKSKRAVGQSVCMQLGPVTADLVDEALHRE